MDLNKASLFEISEGVRSKKISAVEVTKHFFARAEKLNPTLNAFISMNDKAVTEAQRVDAGIASGKPVGKLAGIPVAVKDLLCTEGLRTTAGSKILSNYIPPYSSTVVEKIRVADGIVLGKTSLDEFAMGSSNETSAFGPVKNPWNTEFVPGGSSGGSAAAVAAKLAPAAIGTDTGGSIRQPCNYCGVVGIKPTYGRVSRYGIIAYASSLDQAGPIAGNVRDTALILEAISGFDKRDSTSADKSVPHWSSQITSDLKGLTIGLPREYFAEGLDPEIHAIVNAATEQVKQAGAKIVEVSLPQTPNSISTYYLVATSEASSNLARYDGIRFGHRAAAKDLDELYKKTRGEGFGSEVKRRIVLGTYALSSGYYDAYYKKACQVRRLIQQDFLKAFESCDVLLSPVTAVPPFEIGGKINDPLAMYLNDVYTTSTNLAGLPGLSVPGGFTKAGLPVGVQLTSSHFEEQKIFNVALAIEAGLKLEKVPSVY